MNISKNNLTHDEVIDMIFQEYAKSSKTKFTSLFLASFSTNRLDIRSGLSIYAIMQSFPKHCFELRLEQIESRVAPCRICSNFRNIYCDLNLTKKCFTEGGGMIGFNLLNYHFYLSETNRFKNIMPIKDDFLIFSEIMHIILKANKQDTVRNISSKISKIKGFKTSAEQRQLLLETLGYCSILETKMHKGLLNQYTNLSIAPSKTHSSDWNYPVDFWSGEDGINKDAFRFWFGEYIELEPFWK